MFRTLFRSRRNQPVIRRNLARKPIRLAIEILEDRCVPAVIDWTAGIGDNFNVAADWTVRGSNPALHRVPGPGDDAVINLSNDVITFTESHEVNSLNATVSRFQMSGDSTTLTLDGLLHSSSVNHLVLGSNTTLQVAGDNLFLTSDSLISGTINVSSGAVFAFTGGTDSVNAGATFRDTGSGEIHVAGGKLNISSGATLNAPANFFLDSGSIGGAGTFLIPSAITVNWTGGSIAGRTTVDSGGTLSVSGGHREDFDGATFINNGTVTWTGTNNIVTGDRAALTNNGLWNIQNDQSLFHGYGDPDTFTNTASGIVRKSLSIVDSAISIPFNNNGGTVEVLSGNLFLTGGTSTGGTYNAVNTGTLLDLTNGGTQNISGTFTGSGDGRVQFSGGTLNVLAAGATFNFPGSLFQWTGGQILGGGVGATLTNSDILNISGDSRKKFNGITFNNASTVNWSGGGDIVTGNAAVLNNIGTWTIQTTKDNQSLFHGYGNQDTFNNTGTLRKTVATVDTVINLTFNNNGGTVEVQSGNLYLPGGVSVGGTYNVAAGSLLDLTSGQAQNISGTFTGSGGGRVQFSGGTLNILAAGATLNFPASMFQWTGGQLTSDVPGATLSNNNSFTITGGSRKDINGATFTNNSTGTVTWNGTGDIVTGNAAVVNNVGTWNIQNDQLLLHGYGKQDTFNNTGTFTKAVGATTSATAISMVFNNTGPSGTVNVNSGVLQLGAGGTHSATFNAVAGALLQFSGGTHTLNTGTVLPSDGLTQVTGGATVIVTDIIPVLNFGVINGTLRITSTGMLNVAGNYDQTTQGSLVIEIGGTTAGAGFGQLNVNGTANLAGAFTAVLVNDFAPDIGQSFAVLTYGSHHGTFNGVYLPGLPPGRVWDTADLYGETGFTLTVIPS